MNDCTHSLLVHYEGVTAHVTSIHRSYAQIVLRGTVPSLSSLAVREALSSAGLTASNILNCTVYCRGKEHEATLQSLLAEHVPEVELSPLQPADCDFIVHMHCVSL